MNRIDKQIYNKKPKTFKAQIELLKERNLEIEDEAKAEKILKYISYNRLSNYWFPLLKEPKEEEIFKKGATFRQAFRMYQFDSELRAITFEAIEQIEIAVRTQIIYHLSLKYNSGFWYEKKEAFKHYPSYIQFLSKITNSTINSKKEFILKYKKKYKQYLPPSWKSFELVTFNSLLLLLNNIPDYKDIIPISKSFGLHHSVFLSWIETFIYIRNICAHHSRLWNIKLTISPIWIKSPQSNWVDRWENEEKNMDTNDKVLKIYAAFCCITYCLQFINPYNKFASKLHVLLQRYKNDIDTNHMGFTQDWKNQDLWHTNIGH